MRLQIFTTLVFVLPQWVWAEDIVVRADISQATVFAQGAEITRTLTTSLPAGQHRLLIPMRDVGDATAIQVEGPENIQIGAPQRIDRLSLGEGALDTPAEARARAAVEAAENALQQASDAVVQLDGQLRALQLQLSYLTALAEGGAEGAIQVPQDPALLVQIMTTLGAEAARVEQDYLDLFETRRALEENTNQARRNLRTAQAAFEALSPFGLAPPAIEVEVSVDAATEATFTLSYLDYSTAWAPTYALHLDTQAQILTVERSIEFTYSGAALWRDVAMAFSTANPNRQRAPSVVAAAPARIFPQDQLVAEPRRSSVAEPMAVEADSRFVISNSTVLGQTDIIARDEAAAPAPAVVLETAGFSVVYTYEHPVTLGQRGQIILPLDALHIEVELENRAVPRLDQTAFLIAMGQNTTGETILPGQALFYRDEDLVGFDRLSLIAAGAEVSRAFGPLDHLRLTWQDLSRDEGSGGVFVTSNEQARVVTFGVENTSQTPETVRVIYATPFAEQEDLDITLSFSRDPDDRNIDDLRGVHAWTFDLTPGAEAHIDMQVALTWPEDHTLTWRP